GSRRVAARLRRLRRGPQRREVRADASALAEDGALDPGLVEDRLEGVVEPQDEARRRLRPAVDADVEEDRRVERRLLREEEVRELVLEGARVARRGPAPLPHPPAYRADHPPTGLAHARLPPLRAERAGEVARRDEVGGELAPCRGHLDARLLEHDGSVRVLDPCRPALPRERVEGVVALAGVAAL